MPKKVNKEEKKKHILQAALDSFYEKGIHETKMADVAKKAGIGKGTLYEYFTNKEELFLAVVDFSFEGIASDLEEQISELSTPKEKLESLFNSTVDSMIKNQDLFKVLMEFWTATMSDGKKPKWIELYYFFRGMMSSFIDEGIKDGSFCKGINSTTIAASMLAFLDGIILHVIVLGDDQFPVQQISDDFFQNTIRGME
ncbi:MAG: AcrR family transcriptional regulator [bacterium]|jgi:AcrR family transcriptional regulator